jgi:AraC-like DNA-binding protein
MGRIGRSGDYTEAFLQMPADDDLGGGLAVRLGNGVDDRVAENFTVAVTTAEREPAFNLDIVLGGHFLPMLALAILLYDMWNIYSREIEKAEIEDITSRHFLRFLMSVQANCREQREVSWYARELGLAPKYLSEISKSITGRPAGDWIDSYAAHELRKMMSDQRLTLTDIVDAMHFSSQPALTRYMKRVLNTTPSEFRQNSKS